jgi:hypothetical protein
MRGAKLIVPKVLVLFLHCCSLTYLRDLYSPWELLPAVFYQRDRMLSKVSNAVLMAISITPVQNLRHLANTI